MKTKILKSVLLIGAMVALLSFDLPKDWFNGSHNPKQYEMGINKGAGQDGKNAATIKSIPKKISKYDFGTLMQTCKAEKYIGKRIRMTGFIKSTDLSDWAGLWLRVDQYGSREDLAFDNMEDRGIKGTTAWTKYEIVLDVPTNASELSYGALLSGTGQIWFDNISFEIVDKSVKTTGAESVPDEPTNLDFEK